MGIVHIYFGRGSGKDREWGHLVLALESVELATPGVKSQGNKVDVLIPFHLSWFSPCIGPRRQEIWVSERWS